MAEKKQEMITDEMSEQIVAAAERIAMTAGAEAVTVRKILQTLNITNRVFYNRFGNVEEVLGIVYRQKAEALRTGMLADFDPDGDFFGQVIDIVTATTAMSYDSKMHLSAYIFESDSVSSGNFAWWNRQISHLFEVGKSRGHIRADVDVARMSYAVWCFIRGYNADAVSRGIPRDEAVQNFRYSFGILLDGMRP